MAEIQKTRSAQQATEAKPSVPSVRTQRAAPAQRQSSPQPSARFSLGGLVRKVVSVLSSNPQVQRFANAASALRIRGSEAMDWAAQRAERAFDSFTAGAEIFFAEMIAQAEAQLDADVVSGVAAAGPSKAKGASKPGAGTSLIVAPDLLVLEGGLVALLAIETRLVDTLDPSLSADAAHGEAPVWAWARDDDAGASIMTRSGLTSEHSKHTTQDGSVTTLGSQLEHGSAGVVQAVAEHASNTAPGFDASVAAFAADFGDADQYTVYDMPFAASGIFDDDQRADATEEGELSAPANLTGPVTDSPAESAVTRLALRRDIGDQKPVYLDEHAYVVTSNSIVRTRDAYGMREAQHEQHGALLDSAVQQFSGHDVVYAAMGHAFQPPLRILAMHSLLHAAGRSDRPLTNAVAFDQGFEGRGGGRDGEQQGQGDAYEDDAPSAELEDAAAFYS